jgi:hypothetical protein
VIIPSSSAIVEIPGLHQDLEAHAAHAHEGIVEIGIVAGDDEVAHLRQQKPASDTAALDHGQGWLREIAQGQSLAVQLLLLARHPLLWHLVGSQAREVEAGAEVGPLGAQQHDVDIGVTLGVVQRRSHREQHVARQGVALFRPIENEVENRAVSLDRDRHRAARSCGGESREAAHAARRPSPAGLQRSGGVGAWRVRISGNRNYVLISNRIAGRPVLPRRDFRSAPSAAEPCRTRAWCHGAEILAAPRGGLIVSSMQDLALLNEIDGPSLRVAPAPPRAGMARSA